MAHVKESYPERQHYFMKKSVNQSIMSHEDVEALPKKRLHSLRYKYREYLAEFIGTFTLLILGLGICAQLTLVHYKVDGFMIGWSVWGLAVMCAVYGAHVNPSVTFSLALYGRFPWRKVPGYITAQLLGAFVSAIVIYLLYSPEFASREPTFSVYSENSTLGVFVVTQTKGRSNWMEFVGESFATMMMVLIIFATGVGENEARPVGGLGALSVGLAVAGVGVVTGAYALNPARDIGPRLFAMFLYGPQVFTVNQAHFLVPLVAPFVGATLGGAIHDILCVY